ncbi:adenine-N(1)--methyltransferas-like protein catalytic subunit trm61 [Amylocarpus encephaloides]|uniref:tRNA (adenine(58)-N(1))-methyltransferase catalytic subunit TRM61 n=1 Tax=Amylocarpus encephaloides TaxID=45428 RepID=A0A9P8C1D4_9HELO|nr:adenine-N(1)--methyltransferas-like protein catalytic subunit trm61 [Amylocarpus encephaloides]
MAFQASPFLHPGTVSQTDRLAIVHLKRDLQLPTILRDHDEDNEGYAEGKVVNTRFGSFPHTTLIDLPWGSQVRASKVDTGSRGRRVKKRKRAGSAENSGPTKKVAKVDSEEAPIVDIAAEEAGTATPNTPAVKEETEAVAAASGFIHLLPPTPENWTSSLPHRTQVVYTPDYSYILHRIRARPGTNIIEAGAGSGSFTHASARSVFSGYANDQGVDGSPPKKQKLGKVWSFEFHEQRHEKLQKEIKDHGLEGLVQITHRDVCEDGFLVAGASPGADAVFLDLPAPWLALPNLSRSKPPPKHNGGRSKEATPTVPEDASSDTTKPWISPLNPSAPVHICTFSPCIEQVQRTVSAMRRLGWVDIEMVELSQKRFEIRRDRIGIDHSAQLGVQVSPANVDEAISRLLDVEDTFKSFHETGEKTELKKRDRPNPNNRAKILESLVGRKVYKEGNLAHRSEPEVKTHTSYLVFAVLPEEWTAKDEEEAKLRWEVKAREDSEKPKEVIGMSKRQIKRTAREAHKLKAAAKTASMPGDETREHAEGVNDNTLKGKGGVPEEACGSIKQELT